jgi:endonuclease/exonuclease/phosphatase family metal-dependent hydrolase
MELRVLTWNLFHGRDHPPDPALFTWRSRLLRLSEHNATHLQVNRDLLGEFSDVLAGADWDVALLQECPPRWAVPLADACHAEAHRTLTSRNSLGFLRACLARLNPDLIASNEGGSNLTLLRVGEIAERRELELSPGPRPERRVMAFMRTILDGERELCIANLHASAGRALRATAEQEVRLAATRACEWAGGTPLMLGGDLNLRPRDTDLYEALARELGLRTVTSPDSLDHLLVRGLEILVAPATWDPERREVRSRGLAVRLSDHAPVEATFAWMAAGPRATGPRARRE